METTDKPKIKPVTGKNGGVRPGSGRKKGGMNKSTLERIQVEKSMKQRIMRNAERLLDHQFALAKGCSYLYAKNKIGNTKPKLITDPEIIEKYLDGQLEGGSTQYFYITTDKPDERALENLLDRAFGKPQQSLTVDGDISRGVPPEIKEAMDKLLEKIL